MSKFSQYTQYDTTVIRQVESVLLTVFPTLASHSDDIVLVGGLAVHYLTKRNPSDTLQAVTIDMDIGISLNASSGQYKSIGNLLKGIGFENSDSRLVLKSGGSSVYADFLTESPNKQIGSFTVDDITAYSFLGIERALSCRRMVCVEGTDTFGVSKKCIIPVADVGPLLVLKLNAFGGPNGRKHGKDILDILLLVTRYIDGIEAAIQAFQSEKDSGNTAWKFESEEKRNSFDKENISTDTFTQKRVGMSTSTSQATATGHRFLNPHGELWEIHHTKSLVDFGRIFRAIGTKFANEEEFVAPERTKFRIIEKKEITIPNVGKVPHIVLEESL